MSLAQHNSQKGPPRFLIEGHTSMTKSALAVFIVISCLGLLSCVESCIFLSRLDLFVWLGRLTFITFVISFVSKGFLYKISD